MMNYILPRAGADFNRITRNSCRTCISADLVLLAIFTVEPKKQIILSRTEAVHRTSEQVSGAILHEIVHAPAGWEADHGLKWKAVASRSDERRKSCTLEPEETRKRQQSAKGSDDPSLRETGHGHKPKLIVTPVMLFMGTSYDFNCCVAEPDNERFAVLLWAIALQINTTIAIRNLNHKLNVALRTLLIALSDVQH
ncbi:MAG: hypothetical protein OXI04_11205 [Bacteroidota bacterium]|nr:hypothetical protein [Bacteroidota bacterium]